MLKEKIENHIKENTERKRLPAIHEVHSKQVKDLLNAYLKEGKLKNEKLKNSLYKKDNLEEKIITETMEKLKQRVIATAKKIERYEGRIKQYRENVQFRRNQHLFYRSLDENQVQTTVLPCKEKTLNFWKELWENPVEHNKTASWIKDIQKQATRNKMENIIITTNMVAKLVKKVKNWSAPGLDELHGYRLKHLTSLHHRMATQFDEMLQNATSEELLTAGRTYLIMKDPEKSTEPSNYRLIACLPTMFKHFTRILANSVFNHLMENSLYPVEQKGNYKKSRGTKDQLLTDKMVLKNAKRWKTNLNMAWIDYKKAFDSLPHSWINACLENFGISKNICTFLKANMQKWKTVLTANGENFGEINIR
ncbi:lig1: DNA ligase 1 [Crotalus adamanteus]|uniref:Lig1: DNA ligase 1 n=1 Tax=Crotalus adamanteus TaxID=8729 RepID=A0AAW1B1H5_CROAD